MSKVKHVNPFGEPQPSEPMKLTELLAFLDREEAIEDISAPLAGVGQGNAGKPPRAGGLPSPAFCGEFNTPSIPVLIHFESRTVLPVRDDQ